MQTIVSPVAEWIGELETRFIVNTDGLAEKLKWDIKRARSFYNLAVLVYCCDAVNLQPAPSSSKIEKFLNRPEEPTPEFKDSIVGVMTEFRHIASTPKLNYGFKNIEQKLAPVEFIFIGPLLYVLRGASHETRAQAIHDMRVFIRKRFRDIRTNSTVMKALWEFIFEAAEANDADMEGSVAKGGSKKRKKEDDEPVYRAAPGGGKMKPRPKAARIA
jgi:hypothetical protein